MLILEEYWSSGVTHITSVDNYACTLRKKSSFFYLKTYLNINTSISLYRGQRC